MHRFLICILLLPMLFFMAIASSAQPAERYYAGTGERWRLGYGSEEGGSGGSAYLGVDIADVSPERLGELKLKEEHGAEITMVDSDAPAGKAGLQVHDVIVSLNGTAVESTAQLRRMIKETPAGRVVNIGISRDGQPITIKLQLADRHKSWDPNVHIEIPEMPKMPAMPDFDVPVSVVIVHSSLRSGLMVENLTPQLGEFFGVKGGNGVLVRSVEKGSRGDKSGFRAGDIVVKVNSQPVHDTSDFTHALRSSPGRVIAITVIREKKEQNLNLTLPDRKDSGSLMEDTFDAQEVTAETEQALNRAGKEIARISPAIAEKMQDALHSREQAECVEEERKQQFQERQKELRERLRDETQERHQELKDQQKEMDDQRQELQDQQQERQQDLRHELSRSLADI